MIDDEQQNKNKTKKAQKLDCKMYLAEIIERKKKIII